MGADVMRRPPLRSVHLLAFRVSRPHQTPVPCCKRPSRPGEESIGPRLGTSSTPVPVPVPLLSVLTCSIVPEHLHMCTMMPLATRDSTGLGGA